MVLINSLAKLTAEPVGFSIVIRLSSDYYRGVKIRGKTFAKTSSLLYQKDKCEFYGQPRSSFYENQNRFANLFLLICY